MTLGILVNSDRFPEMVRSLTSAASNRGHNVIVFFMDSGTKLLENESIVELKTLKNVELSLCDHSAKHHGIDTENIPEGIICGSQYNNARLMHDSDKVIVL